MLGYSVSCFLIISSSLIKVLPLNWPHCMNHFCTIYFQKTCQFNSTSTHSIFAHVFNKLDNKHSSAWTNYINKGVGLNDFCVPLNMRINAVLFDYILSIKQTSKQNLNYTRVKTYCFPSFAFWSRCTLQ